MNGGAGRHFAAAPLVGATLALAALSAASATAAPVPPSAQADAVAIAACLGAAAPGQEVLCLEGPALSGCEPRPPGPASVACEKRRVDAWGLVAREAYRALEERLSETDKRLLRTSQVQFELALRDLCAVAGSLAPAERDRARAACAARLIAFRALVLRRMAAKPFSAR
jgi:hypothetical protein